MTLGEQLRREARTGPYWSWLEEMAGRGLIMAMTPSALSQELQKIVYEVAGCSASWSQHAGPLTSEELFKIRSRCEVLLRQLVSETTDHEIAGARLRGE